MSGDFNVVLSQDEKRGGYLINLNDASKFLFMMQQAGLANLGFNRSKYTWSNNRLRGSAIAERLDRALAW